ncbi:MAG: hypothetical protein R3B91_03790 [Planctomycetaceae bacterium]
MFLITEFSGTEFVARMPTSPPHKSISDTFLRHRRSWCLIALLFMPAVAGCSQLAVVSRIFYGEPKAKGFFEQMTGETLKGARVALVCTAPDTIASEYDMVSIDVQEELTRIMSRHDINMVDSDQVTDALDANGGIFDMQVIVENVDADYLFHVDIEHFSHLVPNSPRLYHGRATGSVYGYEIHQPNELSTVKHAVRVFAKEFDTVYPGKNPIPADQTPERVFRNRFIGHVSDEIGRMFYTFELKDTFASR